MRHLSLIRTLPIALLSIAAVSGCSERADELSTQAAATDERQFGPQKGESLYELTPAERRLEWVRRPATSQTQTAAVGTRLAGDSTSKGR